jgi:PAS domain S-box-containing protein
VRSSPLAVIEWDSGHHVVRWTGNAARMFGWEASEVLGKRLDEWRFVYEGDWEQVRAAMDAMDRGQNNINRNRNYRKDGALIHCEWYNSVLLDPTGAYRGGLSLALDTTERKRTEEALQASEEKYRQIVETAPVGIFRSTVDGRFLSVNSKLASLAGYGSPEEVVASIHNIAEQLFVDPQQRHAVVRRAVESDGFVRDEVEYRRPDGSTFPCTLSLRAVRDGQGRAVCLEGFVEDITERRRAEESLREAYEALERRVRERTAELSAANVRLQELDRLKSQFLASMSHELRTPLNSIIGFTSLLRQGLTGPVNAEQKKQLEIIQTSASHLLTLINDLLDVSRIEAGRADLEREPFDFVDVLHEVLRSLRPMADRKGLELIGDVPAPAIPMTGDRKRALQVLLNLTNNAIKFTGKGSVKIAATVERDMLRVTVSDTGIGIRAEHIGMLFEAFRQVDGSAKRVYEGTGLGLYLCRKLLRMMGGEIKVESVYGSGSCFTYTMPLKLTAEFSPPHQDQGAFLCP